MATRRLPSPSIPFPDGGSPKVASATPTPKTCLSWPIPGGSNSAPRAAWKDQIQHQLCDELGITITVAHYPAGASKYNPVERRLFSQISKNWEAEPLTSYDKILKFIRKTTATTGLKVRAYLDGKDYPLKVKPSAERLRQLRITRYKVLPAWNYTIAPSNVK